MNWQAIQAVGEIVAALGVIASLVYLATQVRQNTRSNQAAANQDLLANYIGLIDFAFQSPSGSHLFFHSLSGSWEELSSEEQVAGRQMWISSMRLFDHAYMQHQAGLLSGEAWMAWKKHFLLVAALPGFGSTWPGVRLVMSPSFAAWVDASTEDATRFAGAYRDALAAGGMGVETLGDRLRPPVS